jgi:hypothetical protein
VIRFRCPQCGQMLKVGVDKAGRPVVCPRCEERSVAPAGAAAPATAAGDEGQSRTPAGSSRPEAAHLDPARGLFSGMSRGVRCAVALVAGVGALSLLLPVLSPLLPLRGAPAEAMASWAMVLVPCSVVVLLAMLYGQATGCPSCGKWWARTKVESGFVDPEAFDQGGVPLRRSLYRTTYQCNFCRRRWSVQESFRDRPQWHGR